MALRQTKIDSKPPALIQMDSVNLDERSVQQEIQKAMLKRQSMVGNVADLYRYDQSLKI